ncbi:MAG: DUF1273 family protein [Clostridia bacterium]|nr:DUF1273 family protein [Clostridia bacterium]
MGRICCFTGYRPHRFSFSPDGLRPEQLQAALGAQIRRLYDEGYRTFISGMSAGVDLWAAAEVLSLQESHPDAELIAAVPFEGQENHWPFRCRESIGGSWMPHSRSRCCIPPPRQRPTLPPAIAGVTIGW